MAAAEDAVVDEDGFLRACRFGPAELVAQALAQTGVDEVDVAAKDNYALRYASRKGHVVIVSMLLTLPPSRGVDPFAVDNYALRMACEKGHVETAALLLSLPPARGVRTGVAGYHDGLHTSTRRPGSRGSSMRTMSRWPRWQAKARPLANLSLASFSAVGVAGGLAASAASSRRTVAASPDRQADKRVRDWLMAA